MRSRHTGCNLVENVKKKFLSSDKNHTQRQILRIGTVAAVTPLLKRSGSPQFITEWTLPRLFIAMFAAPVACRPFNRSLFCSLNRHLTFVSRRTTDFTWHVLLTHMSILTTASLYPHYYPHFFSILHSPDASLSSLSSFQTVLNTFDSCIPCLFSSTQCAPHILVSLHFLSQSIHTYNFDQLLFSHHIHELII